MITEYGIRLLDLYKVKWTFNSDTEIENATNKIIDEKQDTIIKNVNIENSIPSKKLYMISLTQNEKN